MLSQTAEYALRAVVFLASQSNEPRTVQQIAAATRVPAGYLAKVMQGLGRAGVVRSRRGATGGFVLARSPERISVLEVVNVVEPIRRFPECPLGLASHTKTLCPLHRQLDDAAHHIETAFRQKMLSDIVDLPVPVAGICGFPASTAAET